MVFEIFNNLIENILISYFIVRYIHFNRNKNIFLIFTVLINTFLSTILTYYHIIGIAQTLLIQLVIFIFLYKFHDDFSLHDMIISLFCNILLFIAVCLSILLLSLVFNVMPLQIYLKYDYYVCQIILSKTIFIIFVLMSMQKKPLIFYDTNIKEINYLLACEFFLIIIMTYYFSTSILNTNYHLTSIIAFCCFVLLFVSFCYIFNKIVELNQQILKDKLREEQLFYQKENLKNLNSIKTYIDTSEHRINYILQSIEFDLKECNYNDALIKINLCKDLMNKKPTAIYTKNELFDFMLNLQIKYFLQAMKEVKVCVFISENDAYNQLELINRIIDILKILYNNTDKIEFFLSEKNKNLFEVKFIINKNYILKDQSFLNQLNNINLIDNENLIILTYEENLNEYL